MLGRCGELGGITEIYWDQEYHRLDCGNCETFGGKNEYSQIVW